MPARTASRSTTWPASWPAASSAARLSFKSGDDGLATKAKFALADVESASLLPAAARPPVTGALGVSVELEGNGLSPVALIGALHGSGKLTVNDAAFAGLDPRAFDAVTRAVDDGLPVDGDKISNVVRKALESGQLAVKRAEGKLAINAGLVRLADFTANSADAEFSFSVHARPHRRRHGRAAGVVGFEGERAARHLHVAEGTGDVARAQHRRVGADRLADFALGRESGEAAQGAATGGAAARAACRNKQRRRKPDRPPKSGKNESRAGSRRRDGGKPDQRLERRAAETRTRAACQEKGRRHVQNSNPPPVATREPAPVVHHRAAPHRQQAPALPAPIDIHPLPVPQDIIAPEASVGRQR